jgi:hypothetical protein
MKRHIDIDTRIDLEGPIDDVIVRLQNIQEKYKDHAGVRIEVDSCYEGGYTYYLERRRLATEAKRVIERESIRRVAYERLKAEFEK